MQHAEKEFSDILGINTSSLHCCLVMVMNVVMTPGDKLVDLFDWLAHELFDLDVAG